MTEHQRRRRRRGLLLLLAALLALVACSGGRERPREPPAGPRLIRDLDASELFPADLDLVLRVDVARMRAGLGPEALADLARRALAQGIPLAGAVGGEGGEEEIRQALRCADVVWYGTRLADLEAGDHVAVIEGHQCMPELMRARWQRVRAANGSTRIFDRTSEARRDGTARIINLSNRATAFVSPVELDAVKRVLAGGPDERRGNPTAEGLLSLDLRAGRLPPGLERKYPSIGRILAGLDRVKGSLVLDDGGLRLDLRILGSSKPGADRTLAFLEALRDSLKGSRYAPVIEGVKLDQVESTVRLKIVVPPKVVLGLVASDEAASPPKP